MRFLIFFTGLAAIAALIASCSHEGNEPETYQVGDTSFVEFVSQDTNNKLVQSFYPDGSLYMMWRKKNDLVDGKMLVYHPNGMLKKYLSFSNDRLSGFGYEFRTDGTIEDKVLHINGIRTGHVYYYSSKGLPFVYVFSGYSNSIVLTEHIDTLTKHCTEKIDAYYLFDRIFLYDESKNESRLLVPVPFCGSSADAVLLPKSGYLKGKEWKHSGLNENNELVFKGNVIDSLKNGPIDMKLIYSSKEEGEKIYMSFVDEHKCYKLDQYDESVTKEQ